MAPSPENDDNPKAPDKQKGEKTGEAARDEKTLSNLNDGELKALLDEAMTYKNPKDREGKSKLFKDLLIQAEETERIARAASAGGSELVRHCNPSARRHHQRRGAAGGAPGAAGGGGARRKPSSASVSEAALHGGSLDNLAKEELYGPAAGHRAARKTVSARQREGGSLPCNVNSSMTPARDYQFLEEAKRNKAMKDKEFTAIDMETESLLENDHLAQSYQEQQERELTQSGPKYTSRATFQVTGSVPSSITSASVDDRIPFALEDAGTDIRSGDPALIENKLMKSQYNVYIQKCGTRESEEKKTDENGNALHQAKTKKKKQADKNVVVIPAESVAGHRGEIINDVNKLMQYIEGTDSVPTGKNKSNIQKSKQLHKQHNSEDGGRSKKQRAHSSKGKESRAELKKSNSLGEISTTNLDVFTFATEEQDKEEKVVMRTNKPQNERPRERRSWGTVEAPSSFQTIYANNSAENLETTDNWVVPKPKKKSKKRRNSISSSRRQTVGPDIKHIANRAPSPDLRGKSAFSMPHSERSNDSSDADSVHSLPIDGPISYADIAKNSEKAKEKKPTPEKVERMTPNKEKPPAVQKLQLDVETKAEVVKVAQPPVNNAKNIPPPDVHNIKSFPSISSTVNKPLDKNKVATNNKKAVKVVKAKDVKVGTAEKGVGNVGDVQPELAIMQAGDSMGLSAQVLPPDVPDVRTIEKMHFLNRLPLAGPVMVHAHCCSALHQVGAEPHHQQVPPHIQHQIQQQFQHQQQFALDQQQPPHKVSPPPSKPSPPPKHSPPPVPAPAQTAGSPPPPEPKRTTPEPRRPTQEPKKSSLSPEPKRTTPEPEPQPEAPPAEPRKSPPEEEERAAVEAAPEPLQFQFDAAAAATPQGYASPEQMPASPDAPASCDSERTLSCDEGDEGPLPLGLVADETCPPPVVILSGNAGRGADVPGLVFGFDINEQLLRDDEDDVCESFASRYMPPDVFSRTSHNHDKIVHFIGMAWESIVDDNVEYYSEDL